MSERQSSPESATLAGAEQLGLIADTSLRFSLARSGPNAAAIRDVITENEIDEYSRFLVVDSALTDQNAYQELANYGIPQLPQIEASSAGTSNSEFNLPALFGVKAGLKPLIHEALFPRESSTTYISDNEIFSQLGRIYRQAWDVTGKIMLDPENDQDSPLWHVALHSFQDSKNLLYLCPPYSPHAEKIAEYEEALYAFDSSLSRDFMRRHAPAFDSNTVSYLHELRSQALRGFREG